MPPPTGVSMKNMNHEQPGARSPLEQAPEDTRHAPAHRGTQVAAIHELADTWLSLQCSMLSGVSRAVVLLGTPQTGRYEPTVHWPTGASTSASMASAGRQALQQRRPVVLNEAGAGDAGEPRSDVLACPLTVNGQLRGAMVAEMTSRPAKNQRAALRVLNWGAVWFEMLINHEVTALENRLLTLVDVLAKGLEYEQFGAAAMAVVTELANRIGCERVSVGLLEDREVRVEAISQVIQIDDKTNLVRALRSVMQEALDQDMTVLFPAPADEAPLTIAHADLTHSFGASHVCTVPMSHNGRAVGALVFERTTDQAFDSDTMTLCESVAPLIGPILDFKRREQQPLRTKIADSLRQYPKKIFGAGYLGLKLTVLALTMLIGVAAFTDTDYRVDAKAHLEGTVQRVVIAPFDGYLAEAPVRAGDLVKAGQVLVRLDDRELVLERTKWSGERAKLLKEYREALASHDRSQISVLKARLDQAAAELALVEEKLARTRVTAPLDGVVVSGDHSQTLGAPVARGQALFQVAPLNSYRIILNVDEREMAAVRSGQEGQLVLAGLPNDLYHFTVQRITPISIAADGQNLFRVEARLDDEAELLRPGMHGVGKIHTGQRRLLWIWVHGVVDWLRLWLWSWWG